MNNALGVPEKKGNGIGGFRVWSKRHQQLLVRARRIAKHHDPVLIEGESGTGKTLLGLYLHEASFRSTGNLVKVGCGEIDHNMIESVLFGHCRGAYTGAFREQDGLLTAAHESSLLLDDIDLLPLRYQSRLLRFLDDGLYHRLGEPDHFKKSDVRLIVTTNKHLAELVDQKQFLPDLYYRLKCWRLKTSPLRERPEDIVELAEYYMAEYCNKYQVGGELPVFSKDGLDFLKEMAWPGNVRELKQAVANICMFRPEKGNVITMQQVVEILFDPLYGQDSLELTGEQRLHTILKSTNWNISLVSRITGHSRTTIYKRIRANGWSMPD